MSEEKKINRKGHFRKQEEKKKHITPDYEFVRVGVCESWRRSGKKSNKKSQTQQLCERQKRK